MQRPTLGGQAVIEGVLIRSPNYYSIAVRRQDGTISLKREHVEARQGFAKLFFVRGIFALYDTLVIGFKAIIHSANEFAGEDEKLGKKEVFFTIAFAAVFSLILFVGLPFYLSSLVSKGGTFLFNMIDGILRAAIFVVYIALISLLPDVKTMFRYHGAEHMSIHAYEAGIGFGNIGRVPARQMTVRAVRRFTTLHPRCGTSFLLFVLLLSIIVFSIVTSESWAVRLASRILLLPVIAGLSYELLKFSARHSGNILFRAIVLPGLMLQKITTSKPSDKQIEVAIAALKDTVKAENSKSK